MIYAFQKVDHFLDRAGMADFYGYQYPWRYLVGPALYSSVLIFNLSITFLIGEQMMGWVGIFIVLLPMTLIYVIIRIKLSAEGTEKSINAHLRDFPHAVIPAREA